MDFYKNNINIKYEEYYKNYQNTSEFIYYNEFVKNREFINILEKNSKLEIKSLKNSLYKYFLNSYTFYKTLELHNVSFYLLNNQEILNMEGSFNDSLTLQIVKDVIENKKDVEKFKIIGEKVYLIFSKPIFNEKLELLGVINFEYDFDLLITKLSKNNNFRYDYFLSNNLPLDENKIINMKNRQKTSLINHLSKGEEF
ncbi:MAG: histidine kinase, partial [Aliarcobacter sp.]|nr:histidine kinase [Aliarcobacter sp.]